ncbi:hypothetical protein HGB07_00400 [Candidatus Roizmanbacteria bacterium]|nr:hypothetical protein [Candidatus Roizmanbacteria bacterium]
MSTTNSLRHLIGRRVKDYSFTIGFFVVFSFFLFFAIRPNLVTVFRLQKELADLRKVDSSYENVIMNIVNTQTILEANRDKFYLLDDAMPNRPRVNEVVDDIRNSASIAGVVFKKIDISEVNLKEDSDKSHLKSYIVQLDAASDFNAVKKMMDQLLLDRRLKMIKEVAFSRDIETGTQSADIRIDLQVEGFYL